MASLTKLNFDYTQLDADRQKYATGEFRKGFGVFKGYTMPESFSLIQKQIDDFEVYDDDLWITTFPKCGTTWAQEMIWSICHDLDYSTNEQELDERMPFIEYCCILCPPNSKLVPLDPGFLSNSVQLSRDMKRPRIIKTHLPFDLLPRQIRTFERRPKIIHIYRNIKDTCVSFFHHQRLLEGFRGDFDLFWKLFITGKLSWTPMDDNVHSYWKHRSQPNFLFLRFEDMKRDLRSVVLQTCDFFKKSFPESEIDKLVKYLSFDSMQKNPWVSKLPLIEYCKKIGICINQEGKFIRKGAAGDYKNIMSEDIQKIFDDYIKEKLKGTELVL
ncbi:luciferin sulfotransferase-like [Atheta coriaria]|uniref:luciferin sulfotransferase-like n=1 Tax=Dalotia coriaria TaxID=877792 RepID=UPI0031F34811